jgi:hypothetical protein
VANPDAGLLIRVKYGALSTKARDSCGDGITRYLKQRTDVFLSIHTPGTNTNFMGHFKVKIE